MRPVETLMLYLIVLLCISHVAIYFASQDALSILKTIDARLSTIQIQTAIDYTTPHEIKAKTLLKLKGD